MNRFWSGKRVFITGHTGFKGGWLSLWLYRLGAHVSGFSLAPPTTPNLFTLAGIEPLVEHHLADIRDYGALSAAITAFAPDIVFHLAAQPLLRLSYEQPVETYATNVMGTVHLLQAVRQSAGTRATIVVTSDKCYENNGTAPARLREGDAMGGYDPYSSSKGCAELVVSAYGRSYFRGSEQALASVRAGNIIGGGDFAHDRLMTDIVAAAMEGVPLTLRMPHATRPWQHVLDALAGYLRAAEHMWDASSTSPEAWNFGPGGDAGVATVQTVADLAFKAWGHAVPIRIDSNEHVHEASSLMLDSSKAARELNWRPLLSLPEGIEATVQWFKRWKAGDDMHAFSLQQIEDYEKRMRP